MLKKTIQYTYAYVYAHIPHHTPYPVLRIDVYVNACAVVGSPYDLDIVSQMFDSMDACVSTNP